MLPLKEIMPPQFMLVDTTSGYIGPATSVANAPSLFKEVQDREYLGRYLDACEGWIPETDRSNDRLCKLMSRSDQQERYMAWRKLDTSPIKAVGKDGHVELQRKRYHPVCGTASTSPCNPKNDTREYLVQYDRVVWKAGASPLIKPWTAHVTFQWHPEFLMTDTDRNHNGGGFQSIALSAEPDGG
jgi:type IV secretory pathway component VirB8